MPTYKPTACLNATYKQSFSNHVVKTYVPADPTHELLYNDERLYRRLFDENAFNNTLKEKMKNKCNIVTAQMTLLYSECERSEGVSTLIARELPVMNLDDRHHVSFSAINFYGENTYLTDKNYVRDTDFNEQLHRHLTLAKMISPLDELPSAEKIKLKKDMTRAISQGDFQQVFHHSEQALMRSLYSPGNVDQILDVLNEEDAAIFGGVILDLYSTRYMCNNCAYHMRGFTHEYPYVLMQGIEELELRIEYPDNNALLFHPRVSASGPCDTNDGSTIQATSDADKIHQYSAGVSPLPLQTSVSKLCLTSYDDNLFSGREDFFLSSDLDSEKKGKSNRDTIDQIIINSRNHALKS